MEKKMGVPLEVKKFLTFVTKFFFFWGWVGGWEWENGESGKYEKPIEHEKIKKMGEGWKWSKDSTNQKSPYQNLRESTKIGFIWKIEDDIPWIRNEGSSISALKKLK